MSKHKKRITAVLVIAVFSCLFCQPAFALTEEEVQNQVAAVGKAVVSGNVLIWFLCAIAFLKVSQKIDSFLSGLGLNVGHTGGSILAEAMIAARGLGAVRNFGGHSSTNINSTNFASSTNTGTGRGLSGGLAGVVSRSVTNSAVKAAVNSPGTSGRMGGLGGSLYSNSVKNGGSFANSVIGTIAAGSIPNIGSLTGDRATEALSSYLGYAALGEDTQQPAFSNVEIGGGRITGTETSADHPDGIAFGMYHTGQYAAPEGSYSTVHTADGTAGYKQYACDAVERTPYQALDGSVAYNETIVKKLPRAPQRKDRI